MDDSKKFRYLLLAMRDRIGIEALAKRMSIEPTVITEWVSGVKPKQKMILVLIDELESMLKDK